MTLGLGDKGLGYFLNYTSRKEVGLLGESPGIKVRVNSSRTLFIKENHPSQNIQVESTSDNLLRGSRKWLLFYSGKILLQTQPQLTPGRPMEKWGWLCLGWRGVAVGRLKASRSVASQPYSELMPSVDSVTAQNIV